MNSVYSLAILPMSYLVHLPLCAYACIPQLDVKPGGSENIKEWLVLGPMPQDDPMDVLPVQDTEADSQPYEGITIATPDGGTYTWRRHQSRYGFIDLQTATIVKPLLFEIDPQFRTELDDAREPSTQLRQAFGEHGIPLSQDVIVLMEHRSGDRWSIVDRSNQQEYLIVQAAETLNVHHEPKNVMAYLTCSLVSPQDQCLEMVLRRYGKAKVWLNNILIHESRGATRWDDERFELPLNEGVNHCLISIQQYVAGKDVVWGFSARVEDYNAYVDSLQLGLNVQRSKPDVLTITTHLSPVSTVTNAVHPAPVSTLFELPSLPVQIDIRGESSQLLATLQTQAGEPVAWAVAASLQGILRITARCTDASGKIHEAGFTCQARNTISVLPRHGQWETYDSTDGLIGSCWAIAPDRQGQLWFGSHGMGVQRYDGKTLETFTTEDGLPSDHIYVVFEDSQGMMWFGTKTFATQGSAGVCRYDGHTFQNYTTEDGLIDNGVLVVYEDDNGHLWFGTLAGVSEFDGTAFRNYPNQNEAAMSMPGKPVGAIAQDADGHFWFGHGMKLWLLRYGGATRYDGQSFTYFGKQDGLAENWVTSIAIDAPGNVWLATSNGVSRYDGETFVTLTTDDGLPSNGINDVIHTEKGELWFATWDGVSRYRDGEFHNFTTRDGLASNGTYSIAVDREGSVWCTSKGGVSRYDGSVESIPVDIQGAGFQDSKGNLWLRLPRVGLGRYDGQHIQIFAVEDGLPSNEIRSFCEDTAGNLWIGTFLSGLVKYDGKQFETFTTKDGLAYNNIESIYEDRDGLLWFAMQGEGIFTYDGEQFTGVVSKHDLGIPVRSDHIRPTDIIGDEDGNLWFATTTHGATRYDGKTFTQFTVADGLPHQHVSQFLLDRHGYLWIATAGGLCRYDGQGFRMFLPQEGTSGNDVSCVFEDSRGKLWFGVHAGGVRQFDGRNLQQLTTEDGLLSNTVWSIHENTEGKMVFVTAGGITTYTPPIEPVSPSISVREVVADRVYRMPKSLSIPTTTPRITFSYHGISFRTKRMLYNYVLEGHDADWSSTWLEQVSYERLEPGEYTFRVIAIDRDLVYSESASVELQVLPDPRDAQIAELESALERRNRELESLNAELRAELQDARAMQMSLMPEHAPVIQGAKIAGKCVTANTVGGDFFGYLPGRNNREVGLVIADVAGHAMKGAMNAVMTDGILSMAHDDLGRVAPARLMSRVNDVLSFRMESDMNVTMVIALLDTQAMTLTLANAAHHAYPLLVRDGEMTELKSRGLPLGMRAGVEYREETFDLQSGDILVLMTDGIIETHDADGRIYGDSGRLEQVLTGFTAEMSAESMADTLIQDAIDYGAGEREDDITVVCAKML